MRLPLSRQLEWGHFLLLDFWLLFGLFLIHTRLGLRCSLATSRLGWFFRRSGLFNLLGRLWSSGFASRRSGSALSRSSLGCISLGSARSRLFRLGSSSSLGCSGCFSRRRRRRRSIDLGLLNFSGFLCSRAFSLRHRFDVLCRSFLSRSFLSRRLFCWRSRSFGFC